MIKKIKALKVKIGEPHQYANIERIYFLGIPIITKVLLYPHHPILSDPDRLEILDVNG